MKNTRLNFRNRLLVHWFTCLLVFFSITAVSQQLYEREYNLTSCTGLLYKGHVIKTADRGYLVVSVHEDSITDTWRINALKTNAIGHVEWTTLLNQNVPFAFDTYVTQTSDLGYIVSGSVWEKENDTLNKWTDCFLVKLNASGTYQWAKRYGRRNINDQARCVFPLGQNLVIAGHTYDADSSKAFLSFIDNAGNLLNTVEYSNPRLVMNYAIPLPGKEIIVAGQRFDTLSSSCFFMRADSAGNVLWAKAIPNTNDFTTLYIEPARNGDLLFTGRTSNAGAGGWDIFALRVTGSGNFRFCRTFGGTSYDEGFSIHETGTGDILLFAEPESFLPGCQTSTILIDSAGTFISMRGYGTKQNYPFAAVRNDEDSTYTVFGVKGGTTHIIAPVFMTRTDERGNFACQDTAINPFVSVMLGFQNFNVSRSLYTASTDTAFSFFASQHSAVAFCGNVPDPPLVTTVVPDTLIVPNVFSPNGDGLNDVFYIVSQGLSELYYEIYNRWGTKLFEANRIKQGWDGRSTSGQECPDGVYYYIVKVQIMNGTAKTLTGFFHLMR